ncbi:small s, partial [Fusarium albosuccineum]
GDPIAKGWDERSQESKYKLFAQLKLNIQDLRSLQRPPSAGVESCIGGSLFDCRIPRPDRRFGPFKTIQEFHLWLRGGLKASEVKKTEQVTEEEWNDIKDMATTQDGPWPAPVFTHGDLNPANIIVRGVKIVGLIDWVFSGWYQHYWEYTSAWCSHITRTEWQDLLGSFLEPFPEELKMERTRQRWWGELGQNTRVQQHRMEALAVASLTGNILQFLEFTSKLVSSARQVLSDGSKTEYLELATIAQELRRLAKAIRPRQPTSTDNAENHEQDTLQQISAQCINITDQLLAVLDSVKLKDGSGKLKSFYQVLKSEWKATEIVALQNRVERIGQALKDHLMAAEQQHISRKLDEIAVANHRLEAKRTEDIRDLKDQLVLSMKKHFKDDPNDEPPSAILLRVAEKGAKYSTELMILEGFRFNTMDARFEGIQPAHRDTFSWIFAPRDNEAAPVSSFVQWLTSADDIYWISGKPGSGKSTLMKYLSTHEDTEKLLSDWAGDDFLIVADFFFWNAGKNSLQRSQQGLLRSLIYQILRRCPELAHQIYPETDYLQALDRSLDGKGGTVYVPNPPTAVLGLLSILRDICDRLASTDVRLCFFIDGLDEYEGQPNDIIQLIETLRSLPNAKICASSRPWNEFEQRFGQDDAPKLYMQDLTKRDIHNYVYDILKTDANYQNLEEKDDQGAELIQEIIEAAQGVFLWVVLVVRSFQEGLTNGDRIVDLQRRLRELPRDLNEYFEKILLADVAEFYREQSARMFTATLKARGALPLIAYWHMDQEGPNYAYDLEISPVTMVRTQLRHSQMRRRLNACCKGLLELKTVPQRPDVLESKEGVPQLLALLLVHARALNDMLDYKTESLLRLLDHVNETLRTYDQKIGHDACIILLHETIEDYDLHFENGITFLHACVRFGLGRYVDKKVESTVVSWNGVTVKLETLLPLALKCKDSGMARILLQKGANPNAMVQGETIWAVFLHDICRNNESINLSTSREPDIIKDLVEHGADLKALVSSGRGTQTAHEVLESVLSPEYLATLKPVISDVPKVSYTTSATQIQGKRGKEQQGQRVSRRKFIMERFRKFGNRFT